MSDTIIAADDTLGLLAVLCVMCFFSALSERTQIGKRLSGPGVLLIVSIVAAQLQIIPRQSPLYGAIWTYMVPLAIALFLIKADLINVVREGGRTLLAFLIGMAGATAGTIVGALVLDLGPEEPRLAAVFSATYTGGSLNFAAVAQAVEFTNASLLSAALAIDNVLGSAYMVAVIVLAGWAPMKAYFGWREHEIFAQDDHADNSGEAEPGQFSLVDLAAGLALAAAVCAVSARVAGFLGQESFSILFTSAIMVAIATLARRYVARIRGEDVVAMMFMYLFFAMVGADVDIPAMLQASPGLFVIVLFIFAVHAVFMYVGGRLLKLNYGELVIASIACISGPPTAAAIAMLFNWRNLVIPGILTGVFGYVVGNFIGVGLYFLLGDSL